MRTDMQQALEIHNIATRRRVKKWKVGLRAFEASLDADETCVSLVDGGADEMGIGIVMLTDSRLSLWAPRLGLSDMMLDEIGAVGVEQIHGRSAVVVRHLSLGPIVIRYGDIAVMTGFSSPWRAYTHFTEQLNQRVRLAVPPESPPPPTHQSAVVGAESAAEQLTTLADLLERGLLTRDEFEHQKRLLLEG